MCVGFNCLLLDVNLKIKAFLVVAPFRSDFPSRHFSVKCVGSDLLAFRFYKVLHVHFPVVLLLASSCLLV